jgi:hypothetical protein
MSVWACGVARAAGRHRHLLTLGVAIVLSMTSAVVASAAGPRPRIAPHHYPQSPRLRILDRTSLLRAHRGATVSYRWLYRGAHGWAAVPRVVRPWLTIPARLEADAIRVRVTFVDGQHRTVLTSNPSLPVPPPRIDSNRPSVTVAPPHSTYVPESWAGPNPPVNCSGPEGAPDAGAAAVVDLDYCGATVEGLAPLQLPANWSTLTVTEQAFVLLDLERLERGETPFLGDSGTLDAYAMQGAEANTDPDPGEGVNGLGSNWFGGTDSRDAVAGYLYDDGPGSGNLACSGDQNWGCWGHRDNILDDGERTDLAIGLADGPNGDSTELIGYAYADFGITWGGELAAGYPAGAPAPGPLSPATITGLEAQGSRSITLTGSSLDTVTDVYFAEFADESKPSCSSSTQCQVTIPPHLPANTTFTIYLLNPAGLSAASPVAVFTTPPRAR